MSKLTTLWYRYSPVQRVFAALVAFLTLLFIITSSLIATELIATNLINTPAKVQFDGQNSKNDSKRLVLSIETLQHGAYLAKVGNCAACHTARGGAAFAGGKAINTPFGTVYTSNITPDAASGIGLWTADAFYRALHEGRSADGHLLTPAFPYPNYTHVTRADSDALYAYFLNSVTPVAQPNRAHELPFPYNTQLALAFWRLMFFDKADEVASIPAKVDKNTTNNIAPQAINTPATAINEGKNGILTIQAPQISQSADLERGAYLVRGLGHCSACHAERNALGASINDQLLSGALMPMHDWYAPSLMAKSEAGVAHWPRQDVVALLKTGIAPNASMLGPMAEVVAGSTQFWTDADLQSTAAYLQSLPQTDGKNPDKSTVSTNSILPKIRPVLFNRGAELFTQHCATCHGEQGQGMRVEDNVDKFLLIPALAGNRAITMANSTNLVRIILAGGYAPSTAGNPRPFGMPPFVHVLNDTDIAAVTTYIRNAWGNQADPLTAADVVQLRQGVMR